MSTRKRKRTSTSPFGTSGRESHDSSAFYSGRMYDGRRNPEGEELVEAAIPEEKLDRFYLQSSEEMADLPDNSVHLMITSPPYNARKEYDDDLTLEEYLALLGRVLRETYRVLASGGRACVNVANLGRKPYIPLHAYLVDEMQRIGYLMRGEIIWNKAAHASSSTAWGSWRSAANPVLRDVHEYILVFSKQTFSRPGQDRQSTIERDDFLELTKSVWTFPPASARKIGHPAPFPEELPRRFIQLYSFQGDVVLDPFCGSGTTCLAAYRAGRRYVGYDINEEYLQLAKERIQAAFSET